MRRRTIEKSEKKRSEQDIPVENINIEQEIFQWKTST
jgi:hypothetical protein